jgi:uncharacterized membrane protein (GlpM family)
MGEISVSALILRFILGGTAVVISTIVARKIGEKAGGIFAAFPAVYIASLLTISLDFSGDQLISHSILLSKGAIIGMVINILIAIIAGYLLPKLGWKLGLLNVIACWFVLSLVVVLFTTYY